jgi:hypothetical protein
MRPTPYSMPSDPSTAPYHQSQTIEDRRRMTAENHAQLANFIWAICNLLGGPYKRNEYRKVILPLTVLCPSKGPEVSA